MIFLKNFKKTLDIKKAIGHLEPKIGNRDSQGGLRVKRDRGGKFNKVGGIIKGREIKGK